MFVKSSEGKYKALIQGVNQKTLAHGKRTLMSEFVLKKGSVVPAHRHPYEQTGYLVKGKMILKIGNKEYEVCEGDSWCIEENIEHSAKALEDSIAIEVFSPPRKDYLE